MTSTSARMLAKTSVVLCALCIAAYGALCMVVFHARKQFPLDKHSDTPVHRDPITIRCDTGSNTEECPARFNCTAPADCERYFQGVYYEGCIGTCVPDMPVI
ncbi:hypothetical protein BBAD15_g2415 [Beauveria bassiana D1-5]|uniref:Uncharacterized protein n=1 Tax=Beauveria bassiana D1-5 TaxID=1245745 RepID=A0A0A2WFD1_BEABA|nr:hypothetical protein BBAD15_g2415 [Beauveria bassiana D1-5]